jgi:hypothetical protein
MKKSLWTLSLTLMATIMLSGCLKQGTDTIALPEIGTADHIIPERIRVEFKKRMPIHEGLTPPDISCSFTFSKYICDYSSTDTKPDDLGDRFMAFYKKNGNTYEYSGKQGSGVQHSSHIVVIGNEDKFTAYFISDSKHTDGSWSTRADFLSGTMTEAGIQDAKYAFIVLESYDPENKHMDVNEYRIFSDQDGLAEFVDWMDAGTKSSAAEDETGEDDIVEAK